MQLRLVEESGVAFVEGVPGEAFMAAAEDVSRVIEVCFAEGAAAALLYAANLPPAFFDLSSGQAGTILQKLRNYGIRLAVVGGDAAAPTARFREMEAEERRGGQFGLFETREAAAGWLARP
ncbi:MAG: DUF4180 domain-containing protein [Chloroflexota bacterium]